MEIQGRNIEMDRNVEGLRKYAKYKKEEAQKKVDKAIKNLSLNDKRINFNTVSKESGVSKSFLYNDQNIKSRIVEMRNKQINYEINQRAKFDKTSKSKDIIILAKEKRISELEKENKHLKAQLQVLYSRIYEN